MAGKIFVLVGAGGAGRALAFGAKSRGARVVVFNRNFGKQQFYATPFVVAVVVKHMRQQNF